MAGKLLSIFKQIEDNRRDISKLHDADRKRYKNASQNFSLINKVALNIIKNDKTKTCSMKRKRRIAAMDVNYLEILMNF